MRVVLVGYTFGGLRRGGLAFGQAGVISLAVFAAAHLFLFLQNTFVVALLGTLVAVAWAFPMAYLFERAGSSLWPPVLVHAATHAIRVVSISDAHASMALIAWLGVQVVAPLLVFAFRQNLLRPSPA